MAQHKTHYTANLKYLKENVQKFFTNSWSLQYFLFLSLIYTGIRPPKTKRHTSWRSMLRGMFWPPMQMSWRSRFPSRRAISPMLRTSHWSGSHILSACQSISCTPSRTTSPTLLTRPRRTSSLSMTRTHFSHLPQETELWVFLKV